MKARLGRRALLAGAPLLLLPRVASGDDGVAPLLARIAAARANLRTMRGPFTQTRTIGLLATDVRSTGILTLVRPDRLRWELLPPDKITFWFGPEGLAYRDDSGQARLPQASARIAGALGDLRTILGGDPSGLLRNWSLQVTKDDAGNVLMDATPRTPGIGLVSLRCALTPDLIRPTRVTLVEGPRDRTVIDFGTLVVDGPVDPASMIPPRS